MVEYKRSRDHDRVFKLASNNFEPVIDDTYWPNWQWCYCLHDSAKYDGQFDEQSAVMTRIGVPWMGGYREKNLHKGDCADRGSRKEGDGGWVYGGNYSECCATPYVESNGKALIREFGESQETSALVIFNDPQNVYKDSYDMAYHKKELDKRSRSKMLK